jgi:hypothetical protein
MNRRWLLAALAVLPFVALCLPYLGLVPMWDARVYTNCITAAVREPTLVAFRCAGHPTTAWALISSVLAWLAPDRFWPLLVVSIGLGILGLLAFQDLVLAIFPEAGVEAAVLTACLGVFPVVVSGAVDINPDHGVLVFFLLMLRALVRGKVRQAAAAGLLLVFSKEPGVPLGGLAAGLWALLIVAGERAWRDRVRRLAELWPLALPPLAFGLHVLSARAGGINALWREPGQTQSLLRTFTSFSLDQPFLAQAAGIFLLQFTWILTALAVWRWARMGSRRMLSLEPRQPRALLFCDLLLLTAALLLTRYQTFLNLRYYVATFPLLLICGYAGLDMLATARMPKLALLGALAALFAISTVRTVDPVSKAVMGTIRFGQHEMLDMTRPTGECCGHGRDQLAYNLEHLHLPELEAAFLADLRARGLPREFAAPDGAEHHTLGRIDAFTFERTLNPARSILPRMWEASILAREPRPQRIAFLRFFFMDNSTEELRLRRFYRQVGEHTWDKDGYSLSVADYVVREDAAARQ